MARSGGGWADENYDPIPVYIANVERAGRSIQRLMENLLQLAQARATRIPCQVTAPTPGDEHHQPGRG